MSAPLLQFGRSDPSRFSVTSYSFSLWNASTANKTQPPPWIEAHPDREISTSLVASLSKWPTVSQLSTPSGAAAVARALVDVALQVPQSMHGTVGVDFEKGAAGSSPEALALFDETSQNPVFRDALGLLLVAYRFPSLPTLPPSATVLKALWPRLQQYVVISDADELFPVCAAGAAGDEAKAEACLTTLSGPRAASLAAELDVVRQTLDAAFPVEDAGGNPVSGSYVNEGDWLDPHWQLSFWGRKNYARLLTIKNLYDPDGLFVCPRCVGSENFSPDGNCRLARD